MLAVITFLFEQPREWAVRKRKPYRAMHVNALYRAVAANLKIPHRFVCLTDQPEGIACETLPVWPAITVGGEQSCYRKIRAFDAEFQRSLADRILCLDLDAVILDDITPLVTDDDCRMLAGTRNPRTGHQVSLYNGSMWMTKAGARHHVWADFEPEKARLAREALIMPGGRRVKGSDQAWFSCVMPNEKTWGPPEVRQFYMLKQGEMPAGARIVFFAGRWKPWGGQCRRDNPAMYEAWSRYHVPSGQA